MKINEALEQLRANHQEWFSYGASSVCIGIQTAGYIAPGEVHTTFRIPREEFSRNLATCLVRGEPVHYFDIEGQDQHGPPNLTDYQAWETKIDRWKGDVTVTLKLVAGIIHLSYEVIRKEITEYGLY